jgi:hypothetical protein
VEQLSNFKFASMSGVEDTVDQHSESQQSEILATLRDVWILAYKYTREQSESFRVSNDESRSKEIIDQLSFFASTLHSRNVERLRSLDFSSSMNFSPSALFDDEPKEAVQRYLKAISLISTRQAYRELLRLISTDSSRFQYYTNGSAQIRKTGKKA